MAAPEHVGRHRYFHVIGGSVWESHEPARDSYGVHFLGVLDEHACWGVDVPFGDDPSDGAALDLFSLFGRTGEDDWLVAGRAVQLVEWARTHRFCGRCGQRTELAVAVDAQRLAPGAAVQVGIRTEHAEAGAATQHLVREVLWQERLGESTSLYLDSGTPGASWVVKAPGHAFAAPGHRIAFGLPATALHLFDERGLALPRCVPDGDVALPLAA